MKNIRKSTSEQRQLSEIAIFWANKAFSETSLTKTHFAELLSEHKQAYKFFKKVTHLMPVDEGIKTQQKNLKKVQRYLDWETAMPADVVKPWAECLPKKYCQKMKEECGHYFNPNGVRVIKAVICFDEVDAFDFLGGSDD